MYSMTKTKILLGASLFVMFSGTAYPGDRPSLPSSLPCTSTVVKKFITKYSVITIRSESEGDDARWVCHEGNILIETQKQPGQITNYKFSLADLKTQYLKQGKKIALQDGKPILLRAVIKEFDSHEGGSYWLLDFREQKPRVIGPIGQHDASRKFSVIWNDDNVIIVREQDRSSRPREAHSPAYLYDYKKNEISEAFIDSELPMPRTPKAKSWDSATDIRDCWGQRANTPECQMLDKAHSQK